MPVPVIDAPAMPMPRATGAGLPADRRICVILNATSGRRRDSGAMAAWIEQVVAASGGQVGQTEIRRVDRGRDIVEVAEAAVADGFDVIVPAGGDGTIMAVAGVAARHGVALGIVPLGTFNFFARGLGVSEDPADAIRVLRTGPVIEIPVGEVNGRIFLNNASLGIYPMILREREAAYRRFGRNRIAAYWSVFKTFIRVWRPLRLTLRTEDGPVRIRTPLLFVARSGFQLRHFGLAGDDCVDAGQFAVFAAPDGTRLQMFIRSFRLVRQAMIPGEDFTLHCLRDFVVEARRKSTLVACDGEKFRMTLPLRFRIHDRPLRVIVPDDAGAAPGAEEVA